MLERAINTNIKKLTDDDVNNYWIVTDAFNRNCKEKCLSLKRTSLPQITEKKISPYTYKVHIDITDLVKLIRKKSHQGLNK